MRSRKYGYVSDDLDSGVAFWARDVGFGNRIALPDWSTSVLRISRDHPQGVPLGRAEIQAFDRQLSDLAAQPVDP